MVNTCSACRSEYDFKNNGSSGRSSLYREKKMLLLLNEVLCRYKSMLMSLIEIHKDQIHDLRNTQQIQQAAIKDRGVSASAGIFYLTLYDPQMLKGNLRLYKESDSIQTAIEPHPYREGIHN